MQHKAPKLLEDIRDSATFILEAVASLTLETYARDRIRRQAVERNFEIIGEALNRLSRVDPPSLSPNRPCATNYFIPQHSYSWLRRGRP